MKGEIVHLSVFDAGSELALKKVQQVLGQVPLPAPLVSRSPLPPYAAFPPPLEVRADPGILGPAPPGTRIEVRLHAVGAVAVRIRVPFEVDAFEDLFALSSKLRIGTLVLADAAGAIAQLVRTDLVEARVDPYDVAVEPERYTVVCLSEGTPGATKLLQESRDVLGALASGETTMGTLSDQQVENALRHTIRYYKDDAVVIGWDDAIIVGVASSYEDVLDVMELANLELLEFRTYDSYLDARLDAAFETLDRLWAPGGLFRSARHVLAEVSQVRVEFARLTDNLHDTGKFFGDWYLAKVHQRLRDRFHLQNWEEAVENKMETLEDMFQLAEQEAGHRRALTLEAMIVLLFIADLALLYFVAG